MTEAQELHLGRIISQFQKEASAKYRLGQREHGGDLFRKSPLNLINEAIKEAIDQLIYLYTLRENMEQEDALYAKPEPGPTPLPAQCPDLRTTWWQTTPFNICSGT